MASKIIPNNFNQKQLDDLLTPMETADKQTQWISKKLKVTNRTWFGKLFWNLIFKRFAWTRSLFGIDPEASKQNLISLKGRIKSFNDANLSKKYLRTINHFNAIFKNHQINTDDFLDLTTSRKWDYFKQLKDAADNKDAVPQIPGQPANPVQPPVQPKPPTGQPVVPPKPILRRDPQSLLEMTISDNEPEAALWLIKEKGAKLDALPAKKWDKKQAELIDWLKTTSKPIPATPDNLDHFALNVGYGYKSANLMVMQQKTDQINKTLKTAVVKVPPFLPISDFEMRHYIFSALPEIETEWKQFLSSFDAATKQQFINRKPDEAKIPPLKITPQGKKIIEGIQKKVIDHFSANCYLTPQIKAWLEKEKPELLIVRSTGKEDTENNSNAGGNDSVPFVKPNAQEISDTIGKVLASYFGEKSVSQRLLAGDQSLFTQDRPFLPVLLQVMVMESGNGNVVNKDPMDIPRSGVLFTTQKDKAENVTFIQTGLGNNEGVVTSQVAVDSYFVDKKGHVHTVVRDKKTRFVRVEKNGHYEAAQINNNDAAMQRAQALPNGVVKDLKKVADSVALHYSKEKGKPKALDMEYTVKLKDKNAGTDKPVIYLLQARPLLSSEVKAKPSYLDLAKLEAVPDDNILNATVLIDIRNDVRNVESTKQIIFADNLTTALKKYTDSDDPQMVKTIVVRKSAPATSHESVVLRPKGVAVLVIEDPKAYANVEKMANEATLANPLKIDTQRGLLVSTAGIADHKGLEIQGLISYPIPREVSIPQSSFFDKIYTAASPQQRATLVKAELKNVEERYTNLVKDLLGGKPPLPFKDEPNAYSLHRLFDAMATGDTEQSKRALGTLLKLLHAKLHQQMKDVNGFQAKFNIPLFNVYLYALKLSEREVLPALYKAKPQSMERLYPIKFLEAAIFQQTGNDIIAADSYARSLKAHVQQNKGLQRANKLKLDLKNHPNAGEIVTLLEMGINATVSQKAGEEWEKFVADLAKSKDAALVGQMHAIMNRMNDLNLLSMGINIIFMDLYSKQKKKFAQVIQEMGSELEKNKATLNWIEENLKLIPSEAQIGAWADPAFAGKQIAPFGQQFLNTFGFGLAAGNSFVQRYNASSTIGKLALLEFMNKSVNTYDAVIKQVTGSTKYPADRKLQAAHFAQLLEPYFEMMQSSLKIVPNHIENSIMKPSMGAAYTFNKFVETLKNGQTGYYNAKYGPGFAKLAAEVKQQTKPDVQKLFEARSEFAVASLVVGSKIDLDFHVEWPTSLEEYFTTFHQNMEAVRNMMTTELGLNKSLLSHQPEGICNFVEQFYTKHFYTPKISYINQQGNSAEIVYNIPLRQHAGFLGIKFNPQKPENGAEITVKMMGNHEHNRWYQAAMVGAWLGNSPPLSLVNNIPPVITWDKDAYNTRSVEFSLHVPVDYPKTQALIKALEYCMMQMTMNGRLDNEVINHLEAVSTLDELDPNFFACTFWGNGSVMQKLFEKHQDVKLAQAIKNSLLAALKYKPKTFQANSVQNYITQVAARNPEAIRQVVTELHANNQLQIQMPQIWNTLATLKAQMVPPQQLYAESIQKKDWRTAMKVANGTKNDAWKGDIINKMKALPEAELKLFIQTLDYDLKKMFTEQYLQYINPGIHAQLQAEVLKAADRGRHLAQLPQTLQLLQTRLNNFAANAEEIVELSKKAMIGLAQNADYRGYNCNFAFENYIPTYVGKAPYHYVWDNIHNDTKKLRKGGPLCIIKAMELKGTPAQAKAFQAVENLINDYLDHGMGSANKDEIRVAVYALSKAYYNNMDDKAAAAAKLKAWWRNSPEHITHLKGSYSLMPTTIPYNLPL